VSHWPFILASYVLTIGGMGGLAIMSWLRMRRAEDQAGALRKPLALEANGEGVASQG